MSLIDKKLNEEKLNNLSFPDCVTWLKDASNHLSYSKGSGNAYGEAREIIKYLIKRYCKEYNFTSENYHDNEIGRLLLSTDIELNDYTKYAKTDKAKAEVIAIFKSDMDDNASRLFHHINSK